MGCVYEAVHEAIRRTVAIKIMHPWLSTDAAYIERLKFEAQIVNDMRHPNVVDILDFIRTDSPARIACVMELLAGPTLAAVLSKHKLTGAQALNAAAQLADALAAVHRRDVVHRDIKPANISVVAPLDSDFSVVPCVKLLDFGIAKVEDPTVSHRTASATAVGTPAYMAPEQVAAEAVSGATDVYALMMVLFEMLTGRRVFDGDGLRMMRQKMSGSLPIALPADVIGRARLEALIGAGLAVSATERPLLSEILPRLRDLAQRQGRFGAVEAVAEPE